jgi:hypothetical protein
MAHKAALVPLLSQGLHKRARNGLLTLGALARSNLIPASIAVWNTILRKIVTSITTPLIKR